jgi:Tol biopolymer transport system component
MCRGTADTQLVAHEWQTATDKEIRVSRIDGGDLRRVPSPGAVPWIQGWHPNGRELLVISANGLDATGDLGFLNIQTGAFRGIARIQASAHARLSADASKIVFSSLSIEDPTQRDIWIVDCASGSTRLGLSGEPDDYSPDWIDNKTVVFISDRGARPRLWTFRLSGGVARPEPVADLVDGDLDITGVTPDGTVVVGGEDIGGSDSYTTTVDWATGRLSAVELLPNPAYKGSRRPVPSPDGHRVAFLRRGRGYRVRPGWQIPVIQELDGSSGGRQTVFPTALTLRDAPAWSSDGRALLFTMPPAGAVGDSAGREWRFVRLDLATGKYDDVGSTGIGGVRLAGLAGKHLYYVLDSKRIMAFDLEQRTSRELFGVPAGSTIITDAAVLGDGERIALAIAGGGRGARVAVVTPPGSEMVEIQKIDAVTRAQLIWCSDRESILASGSIGGTQGIWRIPADGGTPQRLTINESGITEVRLSENGTRLAYTKSSNPAPEVWAYHLGSVGRKIRK